MVHLAVSEELPAIVSAAERQRCLKALSCGDTAMSEPAMFATVRDGVARFFADRWASAVLRREVMWGPEDFESWVLQFEPLDEWDGECDGGAVVDFDRRILAWSCDAPGYRVPRVSFVYQKMLAAAWRDFEIVHVDGGNEALARYLPSAGEDTPALIVQNRGPDRDPPVARPTTVDEARRCVTDDDEQENDDDAIRAWVTLIDADGKTRQRELEALPFDLLMAKTDALQALAALGPAPIPPEAVVSEGIWINSSERSAGFWGPPELYAMMKKYSEHWQDWNLTWLKKGYADQCAAASTKGMPMTNAQAVAIVVPLILSTQQFDAQVMLGAIGGGLKRTANKAVGCLLVVLSLPVLIFGLVTGNWRGVLITIAVTSLVVLGVYQFAVYRFKRMVRRGLSDSERERPQPVVAGPQDEGMRRKRIDELLNRAGLPRLAQVEHLFSDKKGLELLAES